MISDEQVRWIALFFLFSFMDEKTALHSAHKAIAHLKASRGSKPEETVSNVAIIRSLKKTWEQQRKALPRNHVPVMPEHSWILPAQTDVSPWAKFQKDSSPEQLITVILSKVLRFTDHEIAEGLNISLGTARYRIGKGIRQLGSVMRTSDGRIR